LDWKEKAVETLRECEIGKRGDREVDKDTARKEEEQRRKMSI
jgi:hypothetical protein